MADKLSKKDIYVQKEEGNLMVIDPNKVVDEKGNPVERYVPQEDLLYFVNLEANPVPRSVLDLGEDVNSVRRVVATGKVNYLGPNGGEKMDTRWTEDFLGETNKRTAIKDSRREYFTGNVDYDYITTNEHDTQLLGIKDIQITTKPDNLKTSVITIRMVDVRGRALFERGPASIYSLFFHLPYPQFYLTVKGYYGEAITYQMVMSGQVKVQFENDGDYYITAQFMATNQKLLNDIRLQDVTYAPYLYEYEKVSINDEGEIKTCKQSQGYDILKQVYQNYYSDGLIDGILAQKPLTIPQMMGLIERMDLFIENELFDEADISFFSDLSLYGKKLSRFNSAVNEWFRKYCNTQNPIPIEGQERNYFELKKEFFGGLKQEKDNKSISIIEGSYSEALFNIFDEYIKELKEISYFGTYKDISLNLNKGGGKQKIEYAAIPLTSLNKSDFFYDKSKNLMVIDTFLEKLDDVFNAYNREYNKIKDQVEEILSKIQDKELGFSPTLSNVMGVILANTETFLRVMELTHTAAYKQRSDKDRLNAIDSPDNPDSVNNVVYPFPTVYGRNKDNGIEEFYPGDPSIADSIKSYNVEKWPEVKLVEEYLNAGMTIGENATAEFCFDSIESVTTEQELTLLGNIFSSDIYNNSEIYSESSYVELVYRIYNRAIHSTLGTGFSKETIRKMGIQDANNAKGSINKLLSGKSAFKDGVSSFGALYGGAYLPKDIELIEDAKQYLLTKSIEKYTEDNNSYTVLNLSDIKTKPFDDAEKVLLNETKKYESTGFEPYPFNNSDWVNNNLKVKSNIFNRNKSTKYDNTLNYTYTSASNDIIGDGPTFVNWIHPLHTPMFVANDDHISRAFWLLNTIKTKDLNSTYTEDSLSENYFARFMGGDVKEIHPLQLLKWGSIWHRYVTKLRDSVDILDSIWGNLDISQFTEYTLTTDNTSHLFNYDITSSVFDIGFYPELIIDRLNELFNDEEFELSETSIQQLIDEGRLVLKKTADFMVTGDTTNQVVNVWKSYFIKDGKEYMLPSYNGIPKDISTLELTEEINKSVSEMWSKDTVTYDFDTFTMMDHDQYVSNENGEVSFRSIEDLISLFSYETLEKFRSEFLRFAKTKNELNGEVSYQDIYHSLLDKEGVTLKTSIESTALNNPMFIVLHKPINVSLATLTSFVGYDGLTNPINFGEFTTQNDFILQSIVGTSENPTVDIAYLDFFRLANISATEDNMKRFKLIINLWGTWRLENANGEIESFKEYLKGYVDGLFGKMDIYVSEMFTQFRTEINGEDRNAAIDGIKSNISGGVELQKITYRNLKNINDTWIGGFNWSKINLARLFKYINYLNEPIGDKFIMDLRILKSFYNEQNMGKSIGSFISALLKENSLSEPMSFASNVNFYGNLTSDGKNMDESKKVANSIFGIHTDVRKNGLPGFVIFFRSNASEYLNIKKPDFGYKSDSMDLSSNEPNPLSSKEVDTVQIRQGGRGIAFNVDFGIQHQNMFNDFSIQAYDGVKSFEEVVVIEEIANSKKGTTNATISTNLLDVMKTRVYSCSIKMLGNAMIQPFMYFNLRYIPIYSGTYMILSVEHSLSADSGMVTNFTGVRVSKAGISNIDKAMLKARRNLLENIIDKLSKKATVRKTDKVAPQYSGSTDNQGDTPIKSGYRDTTCTLGSSWGNLPKYDVPRTSTTLTNTELKQLINRAGDMLNVSETAKNNLMKHAFCCSKQEQGRGNGVRFYYDNPFGLHVDGGGAQVFKQNVKGYFCPVTSDGYARGTAIFHDPNTETVNDGIVRAYYAFMVSMKARGESYYGNSNFWESNNAQFPVYMASVWAFNWNISYSAVKGGNGKGKLITDYNENGKNIIRLTNGRSKDYTKIPNNFKSFIATYNKS